MKFRPLQDRVVIRQIEQEEKTSGGIFIPDTAKEKPMEGEVVAAGPGACSKDGKIQPLDELPPHWREGQELIVEGWEPSDDPVEIQKWYDKLVALSAQIPAEDHERMAAALAEADRQAKELMRREMGLN